MTCQACQDRGVFAVKYHDGSPTDFAVCLCDAGEQLRRSENQGKSHVPAYHVWAIKNGIDPEHVAPMENILTDDELATSGFTELSSPADALGAIAAAARKRGGHVR